MTGLGFNSGNKRCCLGLPGALPPKGLDHRAPTLPQCSGANGQHHLPCCQEVEGACRPGGLGCQGPGGGSRHGEGQQARGGGSRHGEGQQAGGRGSRHGKGAAGRGRKLPSRHHHVPGRQGPTWSPNYWSQACSRRPAETEARQGVTASQPPHDRHEAPGAHHSGAA